MDWILIAISAYLILALVNLADKFLLENLVSSTKTYTFLVGVLGAAVIVLAPWFLEWPGVFWLLVNLVTGALFPVALLLLYRSLKIGDVSKIIPLIGGLVPIFTIGLALLFLGETFSPRQWLALFFLLFGTVLLAWLPNGHSLWTKALIWFGLVKQKNLIALITAASASLIFAVFFVATKYIYLNQSFLSAFIWVRLGTLLFVSFLLFPGQIRKEIFTGLKSLKQKKSILFFANQGVAAVGFLLQNYAVFLGSVAVVNALQGVQYAFLLILGGLISVFFPKLLHEDISKGIIIQKIIAISLISIGLYFMVI